MGLLRNLFWIALFVAFTFAFVVVFEHGPQDFVKNAKVEYGRLQAYTAPGKAKKPDVP